jgi:hypothetical protein
MANLIDQAFDEAIAAAISASESAALTDSKRVADIVRRIESSSDRQTVIAFLEKFDVLVDLSDDVPERRIIPFPARNHKSDLPADLPAPCRWLPSLKRGWECQAAVPAEVENPCSP